MTILHCAKNPRNCVCERAGRIRAGCRAGVLGRLVADPLTGDRVRVFEHLPCWLDADKLCPRRRNGKGPAPARCHCGRALTNGHRMCPVCLVVQHERDYSQGRACASCGKAICDASKTGYCVAHYREHLAYALAPGARRV